MTNSDVFCCFWYYSTRLVSNSAGDPLGDLDVEDILHWHRTSNMGLQNFLSSIRLSSTDKSVANIWINDDIRPLPPSRRTWTTWTFISFWLTNQIASKRAHLPHMCSLK